MLPVGPLGNAKLSVVIWMKRETAQFRQELRSITLPQPERFCFVLTVGESEMAMVAGTKDRGDLGVDYEKSLCLAC